MLGDVTVTIFRQIKFSIMFDTVKSEQSIIVGS